MMRHDVAAGQPVSQVSVQAGRGISRVVEQVKNTLGSFL